MADDQSGGNRLEISLGRADAHHDEEKVLSISYNHQLASNLIYTSETTDENAKAQETALGPEQSLQKTSSSNEISATVVQSHEMTPKPLCGVPSFNFDRTVSTSVVKRTRGRPRKDCPRPPKHHLNQSVASKVMRGRGRPRRDDILHHKIFPGRPRFRGRKFQHFFMTHASHKLRDVQNDIDIYEDIDSDLKSSCDMQEKMNVSPDAIPDNELKIEKFCSLCNLSEKSLLGQGKFKNFKPSAEFNCFEQIEKLRSIEKPVEVSSEETGGELKLFFRKQREHIKIQRSKQPLQNFQEKNIVTDLIQELEVTGFKTMPESRDIFEPSGELYAHFNCAAWSDGVTKTFEKKLSNVDKAVVAAAFQKCSKCDRYGASVRCCVSECTKIYHYPCAIVSGALQNANCFKIICSIHLEDAFSFGVICMACHESGDLSQLLLCTTCSNYYHGNCMDPPITPSPDVRAGWQCYDCKVCQNCRQPGDSSKMMVCNTCDKGYHTFCVKPVIASVPKSGWKCSACRMCGDCGARTPGNGPSSRWHLNYSVCDSCYQQRNKGIACPLCGKAYRQFSQRKGMKHCSVCQKYIHEECDKRIFADSMDYVCPICTNNEGRIMEDGYEEHHVKDTYQSSSRDSFASGNEESLSSAESEYYFDSVSSKISGRRTHSSDIRRKKPSKPKFKSYAVPGFICPVSSSSSQKEYKMDDDDPTEDNKMILASATDEFVLCQDLCVMCGSFGKGEEGRLIACAQCGQCYHSYCASIKVTTVVLKKGWRCLDCTVCEGCGQPHDESRLLLCDECDMSFHTYCLDPPLQEVPQGNWKCKWCVMCIKCGSKSPGLNCNWQVNYTHCGPCASFTVCCLCQQHYEENDLVIQCNRCERWLHGMCDQIETEEHAEKCAEYGYTCPHCRPPDELPPHLLPPPSPPTPEVEPVPEKHLSPVAKVKEPEPVVSKTKHPVQFYLDGVCLSESGMQYIKSLVPEQPKKIPRPRKLKQGVLGLTNSQDPLRPTSAQNLEKNDDSVSGTVGGLEEMKSDVSNVEELGLKAYDFEEGKLVIDHSKDASDISLEKKKRPRKLQKLGIGGFSVKPRGRCSSTKELGTEQGEVTTPQLCESPFPTPSEPAIGAVEGSEFAGLDKPKRKRKPKKKTHLDENFPNYLRDAFFGKELLMSCKKLGRSVEIHEPHDGPNENSVQHNKVHPEEPPKSAPQVSQDTNANSSVEAKAHVRVQEDVKDVPSTSGLSNKDVNTANLTYKSIIKSEIESIKEEHLSTSSTLTASEISGLPQMDSKDVEDVFQGVLRDHRMSNPVQFRLKYNVDNSVSVLSTNASGSTTVPKSSASYVVQPNTPQGITQSSLHANILQNLHHPDSNSSWPDTDCDQSQMQKNILKWESDEHLGLLSTISPVLYANINLPHLKIEYPAWADRVKQIAKIWRSLPPEKRQPYLQRARENRAASRTQRSNSSDSDRSQKDSKTPEIDPEKQWKQFQALRQLQHRAHQRILQEQRAQVAALKSQVEKQESSSISEVDKNVKLFHSKSLSEIPQIPSASSSDDNVLSSKDARSKIFEKRWSSSAIDVNAAEALLQGNKVKVEVQSSLQQPFIQERLSNPLIHVSRVRTPLDPQLSISDATVPSSTPVTKASDYHSSASPLTSVSNNSAQIQKQPFSPHAPSRSSVLIGRTEIARVATPTIQKETLHTPPATPRPHSSDSFFQMSSPQSQLLASLDTHSQPPPARTKLIGTSPVYESPHSSAANVVDIQSSASFTATSKVSGPVCSVASQQSSSSSSPKPQVQQSVIGSVEQYVLHQSPSFTSANVVKQLSQYKEPYTTVTNAPDNENILASEKSFETQNLEQYLQGNRVTISYPTVASHQQLRDLLQNKKPGDSNLIDRKEGKLESSDQASQDLVSSSDSMKLSHVMCDTPSTRVENNVQSANSETLTRAMTSPQVSDNKQGGIDSVSQTAPDKGFDLIENEKKAESNIQDVCVPIVSSKDDPKNDVICPDSEKKRKTTAGDLMKDFETQQEHDAIAASCNLDVLSADVGELELDDAELLGLGNDFNILEYADPELDKNLVGEGEKSNILDEHLDLDDKDEELEDDVIKEQDTQDKDLMSSTISQEIVDNKKNLSIERDKCTDSIEQTKTSHLPEDFLNFHKKDIDVNVPFETSFKSKGIETCVENSTVEQIASAIKEEPKQAFSSCSLSSQTYTSNINIKLEKGTSENCSIQKTQSVSFNADSQNLVQSRSAIQCPEQIIPPPSYRMVTALKQSLGAMPHQSQANTVTSQSKSIFPLHINMNIRQDLPLSQQNVITSTVPSNKPLLLQEQPLLLEELVEQEKREQRRQTQEGLISPHGDALLSDIDFERLKDDVFSGPPDDSIGGPGSLLGSHEPTLQVAVSQSVGVPPSPSSHNFGPPPYSLLWQNHESAVTLPARPVTIMQNIKGKAPVSTVIGPLTAIPGTGLPQKTQVVQGNVAARTFSQNFVSPPSPPVDPLVDPEKLKVINYEKYLLQQQAVLTTQQKYFETEVIKLRKIKKALNAKQRQLRKNGSELTENDALELAKVSQEQAALQKQLDQVRKQTRQNTLAIQDYRLKQQKRQQQPPTQVPRSPLHTSVSSVQSSPQNSQSPLQFSHAAPQSPLMPTSPVSQSGSVRIQHSPSPLSQPPVSMPSSGHQNNVQSQIYTHQLPLHFQVSKSEGKTWVNPIKVSQVSAENIQMNVQKREQYEKGVNSQVFSLANTSPHIESSLKGFTDAKNSPEDVSVKHYQEDISSSAIAIETPDEQKFSSKVVGSDIVSNQSVMSKDQKPEIDSVSDPVPQSILSQSLPSSVSNTLKFTLRQTGMPTVCLPTADSNTDNSSELKSSETKSPMHPDAKVESKENQSSPETISKTLISDVNKVSIKVEQSSGIEEKVIADNGQESNKSLNESSHENSVTSNGTSSQKLDSKGGENSVSKDLIGNGSQSELLTHVKIEITDDVPIAMDNTQSCEFKADAETLKTDERATQAKKDDANEASSDEELENLTKTMAEGEQEQGGEQNVLLKQLLQNCPSAETPRKTDGLIELRKDDGDEAGKLEVHFELGDMQSKQKLGDPKSKKPSYLDIRRAQLEKEPTPPPGEKAKPIKRKRPKKKKLEQQGKPDGILAKKKCRRSSSRIEEGYEAYVETLMNKLTNLPPLRIIEPNIKPNFSAVPVFGTPDLNVKDNQLKGCFGSATIPDQNDVYSYFPYTKEQPSSSSILPPSSPPYRGFYNQEFPAIAKAFEKNEMSLALKPHVESECRKISRDAGSPDTVISSSSPESCLFEPLSKWPKLVFIDKILPEDKRNSSPVIPLMYPVPIRLYPKTWNESHMTDLDEDKDKENIPDEKSEMCLLKNKMSGVGGYSAPLKDSGNVAVTLTLTSAAAEDICSVLSALADILKIPIPSTYEIVERTATPPSQKLGLYRRSKNSEVSIHSLMNGKPRFCRHCDIVVLSAGIRKKAADLACISREEQDEDEVIFCSTNCYMQFALTHRSTTVLEKEAAAVVDHIGESTYDKSNRNINNNAEDSLSSLIADDKDMLRTLSDTVKSEATEQSKRASLDINEEMEAAVLKNDISKKDAKDKSSSNAVYNLELLEKMDISEETEPIRKWRSVKYKFWCTDDALKSKRKEETAEKTARPFYHTIKPAQMPKDERKCIFCHATGDGDTNGAARLLNVDVNKWVHLNCALWSAEVYETVNGALMNVEIAFKRSRHLSCCCCHKQGASVRCFKTRCPNIYHFPCARKEQCAFFKDKTMLCPQHTHRGNPENRLESVAVFRRVYINREEHKQVASMIQDDKYVMRIGSLIFLNIGQLLPQQIQAFHTPNCIYPVGYKVIRMYWSMRKLGRRSQYVCTINEVSGKPEFTIQVKEVDQKELILKDKLAKGVWQKVIYPIEKMRRQAKTIKIFPDFISGDDLFGLTEPAVLRIIESLPGVDTLNDYNFRYGRSPFLELPLAINPTGCARSEPKLRTHFKRPHTLHTSNSSRSFHSAFAGIEVSSPYIKQFVHSKSSQYRKMKTEWRNNVFLARSRIQGLGLYAARDLEKHTMVIEYIGQLIRNEIAERNEAIYEAQNRGVYMFRLGENRVIDATLSGGLARYMNHSCNPNCVAEVVQIDRENKILIITNRRVTRGEELSYDYKFEVEDDQHKIPCLCGAPNCRKWMN